MNETKDIFKKSVEDFLSAAASSAPTPGGGSVAAFTGALSAALLQMVGSLTVGKKKYADVEEEIKQLISKANQQMEQLKKLAYQDMDHFNTFMQVLSLPKDTAEQAKVRDEKLQCALKEATETPMAAAAAGLELLKLACRVAEIGTKTAVSDAGVAALLADAMIEASLITADCNLIRIKDQSYVNESSIKKDRLQREAKELKEKTLKFMRQRMQ